MSTPPSADTLYIATRDQLSTEQGGEIVFLGLRDGIYYGLSGAGARLWQLLETPRSLAAVVDRLVEEFDVTRDELQLDLELLLESLRARGLVAIASGPGT